MFAFGEYPQAYTPSDMMPNRANVDTSAKLTQDARFEMGNRKTKIRISRALYHQMPHASDEAYSPVDQVVLWREKVVNNRIVERQGPYPVESLDPETKLVTVRL